MTDAKPRPPNRQRRCPICRAPVARDHAPFCSRRCADRDLARWLGGEYRVPTDDTPSSEDIEEAFQKPPAGRA
jgi:hypothetical protein